MARVSLAFLVAPAVAALAFSCVLPMYAGLSSYPLRVVLTLPVVALVGGYLPELVFGIPLFLFARRFVKPSLLACAICGSFVAGLPWLLLAVFPAAQEASIDGRLTVVNHHLTLFGLTEGLKLFSLIALFGGFGGAVFWSVAVGPLWPKAATSA